MCGRRGSAHGCFSACANGLHDIVGRLARYDDGATARNRAGRLHGRRPRLEQLLHGDVGQRERNERERNAERERNDHGRCGPLHGHLGHPYADRAGARDLAVASTNADRDAPRLDRNRRFARHFGHRVRTDDPDAVGPNAAAPGISALGESLSSAGTSITPSTLSTPTTGTGAAASSAVGTAPAATPSLFPYLID